MYTKKRRNYYGVVKITKIIHLCQICLEEDKKKFTTFKCSHDFCSDCVYSYLFEKIKKKNSIKNEEMMKEIKNTLDDNLKVMFNFSYENFLSKESESESKKSSQQEIIITESYD